MSIRDIPDVEAAYPDWEGWASLVGGQLHARVKDAACTPATMVHADDLPGLYAQIDLAIEQNDLDSLRHP